ncbi:MAG: hypothetical protein HFI76_03065 [Lachnospiraceae bacterium]|nr:hypothetical protein [Lachnospiraceae bacterium]
MSYEKRNICSNDHLRIIILSQWGLKIPNKELMMEFEHTLEDNEFEYIAELARNSEHILEATFRGDGAAVSYQFFS